MGVFREHLSSFVCVPLSLFALRVGCGIRLYKILTIVFLFTQHKKIYDSFSTGSHFSYNEKPLGELEVSLTMGAIRNIRILLQLK